jgi:PAS domain S-box-containing protein
LEQILNSTSAVIYEKDSQGRYEFVNNGWARLFDVDPEEIKGKTDYDVFPREMAAAFCRNDRRVIDSRQSLQIEEVAPHTDGPHTDVSVKVPVWDANGRIRGVAGISTDISEQLAATEELKNGERLAAIGKMVTGLARRQLGQISRQHLHGVWRG